MSKEITCPKCSSNHIVAARKSSPAGTMAQQTFLSCGTGLPADLNTASDIDVSCLRCGYAWNPKQLLEKPIQQKGGKTQTAFAWIAVTIAVLALVYWIAR